MIPPSHDELITIWKDCDEDEKRRIAHEISNLVRLLDKYERGRDEAFFNGWVIVYFILISPLFIIALYGWVCLIMQEIK